MTSNRLSYTNTRSEAGFSLLESVTSLFILSLFIGMTVPAGLAIIRQERVTDQWMQASDLAIQQIETAHATGTVKTGTWTYIANGTPYTVQVGTDADQQTLVVKVQVHFQERGNDHAVTYQTIVPNLAAK